MKLQYHLKESDYLTLLLYHSSNNKLHLKKRRRTRILVPIVYLVLGGYVYFTNNKLNVFISFILFALFWWFIYPFYSKWNYKRHFKKIVKENFQDIVDTLVEIELIEAGILVKDHAADSHFKYNALQVIIETQDHLFIKISTVQMITIPKNLGAPTLTFKDQLIANGVPYINDINWSWS